MNTFFLTDLVTPDANVAIILPELIVAFTGVVGAARNRHDGAAPVSDGIHGCISTADFGPLPRIGKSHPGTGYASGGRYDRRRPGR